jgi:phage gp36-like protein
MAYATYADLVKELDARIVAELCSDTGSTITGANPVSTTALDRASSMVDAYARVGNIYTSADLAALALAGDYLLVALVVDLATEILFQRRAMRIPPAVEERLKRAREMLEHLRDGRMIFGAVAKAADAGLPEVRATPAATNAFYGGVSTSSFFPMRRNRTMPGG